MRVFVTGTGRCGTVTFSKACEHVHGFTVGHETAVGKLDHLYPDNHIEVDPHLAWKLPTIRDQFPEARWVILHREREALVRSIASRGSLTRWWGRFCFGGGVPADLLAPHFVDHVNALLEMMLPDALHLTTPVSGFEWDKFERFIEAWSDVDAAMEALQTVHNATKGGHRP